MTVDPGVYALAESYATDRDVDFQATPHEIAGLADAFQQAIEDEIESWKRHVTHARGLAAIEADARDEERRSLQGFDETQIAERF